MPPDAPPDSNSTDLAEEKLKAEIEKLKVETANLHRSRYAVFGDWAKILGGIIVGAAGTFTFAYQWQIADLKNQNAKLEQAQLEKRKQDLETQTDQLGKNKKALEVESAELEGKKKKQMEEVVRLNSETERLEKVRKSLVAEGDKLQQASAAVSKQIEENKTSATTSSQLDEIARAATARTTSIQATVKQIQRPAVFVYYANQNQSERYKADMTFVMKNNGFEVRHEEIAPEEGRPEHTSYVLYFHDTDAAAASSLAGALKTQLDVRDCKVQKVSQSTVPPVPTTGRNAGEIEIWLDRSERSPAAGLIRLLRPSGS
jgi:DNA repair exonuclease SbcCD ATPase subunit